jgi:C4-dicarboxylate-specific signal transduction histidine kinase
MERIIKDGRCVGDVIDRIRLLLRKGEPRKEPRDLNEVIHETLTLTRNELAQHQIAIRTDLSANRPPVVGDRVQLQQVHVHLILNVPTRVTVGHR